MKPTPALLAWLMLTGVPGASAWAALGGDATSVEVDRARLKGELRITSAAAYSVHEITASSGLTMREYVAPGGKVFAVSWRGPAMPDLRQVLGSYYAPFQQAASVPHYNHHHLAVQTPEVIVQSGAHLRMFIGRAWAPALLPPNFSTDEIN